MVSAIKHFVECSDIAVYTSDFEYSSRYIRLTRKGAGMSITTTVRRSRLWFVILVSTGILFEVASHLPNAKGPPTASVVLYGNPDCQA